MKAFTTKQQRFVEAYCGNATEAAIKAGYSAKTAYSIGEEILKKPEIMLAIQKRETKAIRAIVADREELQAFWTTIVKDAELVMRDRLKASELLGKSLGMFLERVDLTNTDGNLKPTINIDLAGLSGDDLRALTQLVFEGERHVERYVEIDEG